MALKKVDPNTLMINPFSKIRDQWALLGAGTPQTFNMMTVNWGGLGVLWFHNVCTVYVRQSRYTKTFVDENDYFTLTFLQPGHEDALKLCGAKSGRDINKMTDSGLTPIALENSIGFAEAETTLVCRKLYHADMPVENLCYEETRKACYPQGDYHTMYIGEIIAVYQADPN